MLSCRVRFGAALPATTVTIAVAVPTFPARSDALKVTVVCPSGREFGILSVIVKIGPSTLSNAVAANLKADNWLSNLLMKPIPAPAITVMSAGGVITGGTVSPPAAGVAVTVTFAVAVPLLLAASLAEKVTVVTPTGKVAGALLVMAPTTPTLSVAVAAARNVAIAALVLATLVAPAAVGTVMLAGAVTVGAIVSATAGVALTVTVAVAVPMLPAASVAEKVTVVTPTGKLVGALLVMAPTIPTLSVAVAAVRNVAIVALVAATAVAPAAVATVIAAGALTTGSILSNRV